MEMEKDVREDAERAIARCLVVLDAEDGAVELGLLGILQPLDLLLALFLNVILQPFRVLLDAIEEPRALTVAAVFFRHPSPLLRNDRDLRRSEMHFGH